MKILTLCMGISKHTIWLLDVGKKAFGLDTYPLLTLLGYNHFTPWICLR